MQKGLLHPFSNDRCSADIVSLTSEILRQTSSPADIVRVSFDPPQTALTVRFTGRPARPCSKPVGRVERCGVWAR